MSSPCGGASEVGDVPSAEGGHVYHPRWKVLLEYGVWVCRESER